MTERALSRDAIYRAVPTVRVDGKAHVRVTDLLSSMPLAEAEGGLSALELRFDNLASDPEGGAALAFEDERRLRLGATIAVYADDEKAPQEIFRGTITAIEGLFSDAGPELSVLAEDALQRARMAR